MREKRLLPALKAGKISESDLVNILRESEEYGHQHVFTFRTTKVNAATFVNENTLRAKLKALGREDLLEKPEIVDAPSSLTLTDARLEQGQYGRMLVLKAVDTEHYSKLVKTEESGARFYTRTYERLTVRAVHVLSLNQDATCELRVYSHDYASDYGERADKLWDFFSPLVDQLQFEAVSIMKAQRTLWKERRGSLSGKIRYSDSRIRNLTGSVVYFATGKIQSSLFDDPKAKASFDTFYDDEATCDRSNLWFLSTQGAETPSKDMHVHIGGRANEFALPGACSRKDYEYVLDQIRRANN